MTLQNTTDFFHNDITIIINKFIKINTPSHLIKTLLKSNIHDLTLITNNTAFIDTDIDPLIVNNRIHKIITSHIDTNPKTNRHIISNEINIVLIPQNTLIEQIHYNKTKLNNFLTPTNIDTVVKKNKQTLTLDNKT